MRKLGKNILGVSIAIILVLASYYITDRLEWKNLFQTDNAQNGLLDNKETQDVLQIPADSQNTQTTDTENDRVTVGNIGNIGNTGTEDKSDIRKQITEDNAQYLSANSQKMEGTGKEASESDQNLSKGKSGDSYDFDAKFYPYYAMLNELGQNLYRQIYANAMAGNAEFLASEPVAPDQLENIMSAVYNDHPEIFWLDLNYMYTYSPSGVTKSISLTFNETINNLEQNQKEYDQELQKIVQAARAYQTDVEKEKFVHDYLCEHCTYDLNAPLNQNSYSALVNGVSVCAGYSRAMQHIMTELGIPCYYCIGTAQGGNHAWNIINLNQDYYHLDISWDDNLGETYGTNAYIYYNVTDSQISEDHARDDLSVYLPACNGTSCSYENLYGNTAIGDLQESQYKSYQSLGFTENEIITDINQYNQYACDYLSSTGKGEQVFSIVIKNKELLDDIYESIQSKSYVDAYMQKVINSLHVSDTTVRISMEAEQLQDGYMLMKQTTWIE